MYERKEKIERSKARYFRMRLIPYTTFIFMVIGSMLNLPTAKAVIPKAPVEKHCVGKCRLHVLPADRTEWEDVVDVGALVAKANKKYARHINAHSKRYSVDPKLAKALMIVESELKEKALSLSGAIGLMQLMRGTAKDMGIKDPWNANENIKGGVKYLRYLAKKFNTDEEILAAYNKGPKALKDLMKKGFDPSDYTTDTYVFKIKTTMLYPDL